MANCEARDGTRYNYLFQDRFQTEVIHDPADGLLEKDLPSRGLDRIIGLRKTNLMKDLIAPYRRLRHSPFGDGNVLYPFLVIDTRSDGDSLGFESIEHRTAFQIRTLVNLQYRLQLQSHRGMDPLVWVLANQKDQWRVSAAIMDNSEFVSDVVFLLENFAT